MIDISSLRSLKIMLRNFNKKMYFHEFGLCYDIAAKQVNILVAIIAKNRRTTPIVA